MLWPVIARRDSGIETIERDGRQRSVTAAGIIADELCLGGSSFVGSGSLRRTHRRSMELAKNGSVRIRFRMALEARGS